MLKKNTFESLPGYVAFVETDHKIIPTVILHFHWFKEGNCQLLVKVCAQVPVNRLQD